MKIEGKSSNVLTAQKVKITDDDQQLEGVASAVISIDPGEPVMVQLRVYVDEIDLSGVQPCWMINDPRTGDFREITKIEFKDGETLEF